MQEHTGGEPSRPVNEKKRADTEVLKETATVNEALKYDGTVSETS